MAKPSRRKDRQGAFGTLALFFICLMGAAIAALRHRDFRAALILAGVACFFLSVLLTATWHTKCRVKTSRGKPCKYDAYGFVFGCSQYHFWDKFWARFGVREREPISREGPRGQQAVSFAMSPPVAQPGARPIRVTIEEGAMDKCGFWINVSAAVLGLAQVAIGIYALH